MMMMAMRVTYGTPQTATALRRGVYVLRVRASTDLLQIRCLAVEHEDRFDAGLHDADGAVEHALDVARHVSFRVGQRGLRTAGPGVADRDEKLVNVHRRINCDNSTHVRAKCTLFHAPRRGVGEQLTELFDAHGWLARDGVFANGLLCRRRRSFPVASASASATSLPGPNQSITCLLYTSPSPRDRG